MYPNQNNQNFNPNQNPYQNFPNQNSVPQYPGQIDNYGYNNNGYPQQNNQQPFSNVQQNPSYPGLGVANNVEFRERQISGFVLSENTKKILIGIAIFCFVLVFLLIIFD